MQLTELFQIDGVPMIPPDQEVRVRYEDIDAAAAGRDESGVMHRIALRQDVGSWEFRYSALTDGELEYLRNLFRGKAYFQFTFPGKNGPETRVCYRSGLTVSWKNARTGLWRGCGFTVIEC